MYYTDHNINLYQKKYKILLNYIAYWVESGIYFSDIHMPMDEYYLLLEWDSF